MTTITRFTSLLALLSLIIFPFDAAADLIGDFPDFEQVLFRGQVIELHGSMVNDGNEAVGFQFDVEFLAEPDEDPPPPWLFCEPVEGNLEAGDQIDVFFYL